MSACVSADPSTDPWLGDPKRAVSRWRRALAGALALLFLAFSPSLIADSDPLGRLFHLAVVPPFLLALLVVAIYPSLLDRFGPDTKPRVHFTERRAYRAPASRSRLLVTSGVLVAYSLISTLAFWSPDVMDSRKGPGAAGFIACASVWYGLRTLFDLITRRPRLEIDEAGIRGGLMRRKILWQEITHLEKKVGGGLMIQTQHHFWPPTVVVAPHPADRAKAWALIEQLRHGQPKSG